MREIKFRAWHKRYKKMYEVHDLILNSIPNEKNPKVWANCWGKDIIEDKNIILHMEDLEVQQFTGLKDKNGKEIFEGDIIKFRSDTPKVIEWSHHMWKWVSFNDEEEVIGNIYENPELLTNPPTLSRI